MLRTISNAEVSSSRCSSSLWLTLFLLLSATKEMEKKVTFANTYLAIIYRHVYRYRVGADFHIRLPRAVTTARWSVTYHPALPTYLKSILHLFMLFLSCFCRGNVYHSYLQKNTRKLQFPRVLCYCLFCKISIEGHCDLCDLTSDSNSSGREYLSGCGCASDEAFGNCECHCIGCP